MENISGGSRLFFDILFFDEDCLTEKTTPSLLSKARTEFRTSFPRRGKCHRNSNRFFLDRESVTGIPIGLSPARKTSTELQTNFPQRGKHHRNSDRTSPNGENISRTPNALSPTGKMGPEFRSSLPRRGKHSQKHPKAFLETESTVEIKAISRLTPNPLKGALKLLVKSPL